jgi:predicted HicB family RNase H-like nuclease
MEIKRFTVRISEELIRKVKIVALEQNIRLAEFVEEALKEKIQKCKEEKKEGDNN